MPEDATSPHGEGDEAERGLLSRSRLRSIIPPASVVIGLGVLLLFGDPVAALERIWRSVLVSVLLALASIGTGAFALAGFGRLLDDDERTRSLATLLIVGYPLFGAIEFLFALGTTDVVVLLIPAIALAVLGTLTVRRQLASSFTRAAILPSSLAAILLSALLLAALCMALLPAVSLDEVSYHLAIPKIWVAEGSAVPLPLMSHSFFPLGAESADLPAIAMLGHDGAIASHLLHLFIAIAMVVIAINAISGSSLAAVGIATIASTPALMLSAGWSGTDVPLVAVSFVLFLHLDRFVRSGEGRAGIATAIAAGLLVKYTFVPLALVLVGAAFLFSNSKARLLVTTVVGGLAGSVFFIRNLILTGNPVEPFLTGGGEIARFRWSGSWGETLTSYLFDTKFIDDSLGFVLPGLALAALALSRTIEPRWRRVAAIGMLVAVAALSVLGPSGRILLPFLVVPAWIALTSVVERKRGIAHLIAVIVLVAAFVVQFAVVLLHVDRLDPLAVVSGEQPEQEWLMERRSAQRFIDDGNTILDEDVKTLVLGVNELFWFDGRVSGGANFDSPRLSRYLERDGLGQRLRDDGIEAVLIYPRLIRTGENEVEILARQRALALSDEAVENLRQFLDHQAVIQRRNRDAVLYRLTDAQ